jgi:serine protease inhibitor
MLQTYSLGFANVAKAGITAVKTAELAQIIENELGLGLDFKGVNNALVTLAKSKEKFSTPFDQTGTKMKNFYNNRGVKHSVMMMEDYRRQDYQYINDGSIFGAVLPYESKGKLVVLMANPSVSNNILEWNAKTLNNFIEVLLESQPKGLMPLLVPKAVIQTEPQSILKAIHEQFDRDYGYLLSGLDDFIHASQFKMDEKGTTSSSIAIGIAKSISQDELVFDHPFLALVLDEHNKPLFINYYNN